ncbi:hypothetical protein R3P38DRAFT_2768506 [Favolaschia claudopus]|uniref:Uncharacterized protein n=1 Tax=Favolaschia claudopus TaxID=2862362 RepID=A0AAW0CQW2_9AGAR
MSTMKVCHEVTSSTIDEISMPTQREDNREFVRATQALVWKTNWEVFSEAASHRAFLAPDFLESLFAKLREVMQGDPKLREFIVPATQTRTKTNQILDLYAARLYLYASQSPALAIRGGGGAVAEISVKNPRTWPKMAKWTAALDRSSTLNRPNWCSDARDRRKNPPSMTYSQYEYIHAPLINLRLFEGGNYLPKKVSHDLVLENSEFAGLSIILQ